MDHKKSQFYFTDKGIEWMVEYYYVANYLAASVYEDGKLYHDFKNRLPNTRTENPTKTQAKEIISAAKKLYKDRDKRDAKLKKLLD